MRNGHKGRLPKDVIERIRSDLGSDNLARSGEDLSQNRRYAVRASVTALHVPVRNTQAADGTTFTGLPGNRLAENAVSSTELSSHASNDSARAVIRDAIRDKAVNNDKINDMDGGKLHSRSVPDAALADNIGGQKLRNNSVPGDKIIALKYSKLQGAPNLGKFVTSQQVSSQISQKTRNFLTAKDAVKFLTKAEADRLYAPRKK